MSFQKCETDSFCVGQEHYSVTKDINGEISFNKKTCREIKLLVERCSVCNKKKSIIVGDNTMKVEGSGNFFKNLGSISAKTGKKIVTNVLRNPARALEITSNIATAAATKTPK